MASLLPRFTSLRLPLLLLAICLGTTLAQSISDHDLGCVHLPIIHSTNALFARNARRAVAAPLANRSDVAYYAKLNIGTPPQPVYVQLDTGSFELWVNPTCTNLQGSDASFCNAIGQYVTTKSSSAVNLGNSKVLRYGIGAANVTYFRDTISLPGATPNLQGVQFGVATATQDEFSGILGIGYGQDIALRYPNFIDELQDQNATTAKAFSIALGSKASTQGVIVFGGVDTGKFYGPLTRLPIIPANQSPDGVPRYWVHLDSVSLAPPSGVAHAPYPNSSISIFLDSGATMTLLPRELANAIAVDFGAGPMDTSGFYEVSCSLLNLNGTLNFTFNGTTIKVPYSELIRTVDGSQQACFLGISPSDDFVLLGDTFLRSAYAVFDLDSNSVWMTQAKNCASQPAAISSVDVLSTIQGTCTPANEVSTGASSSSGTSSGTNSSPTGDSTDAHSSGPRIATSSPGLLLTLIVAVTATLMGRVI